jgi:superfamily I DNA/RNA helicase
MLVLPAAEIPPARTIHSVKGMEFIAVCVVTTPRDFKGILDYLETGSPSEKAEMARELYVAASRAGRLLVMAIPKSQRDRFSSYLQKAGVELVVVDI